MPDNLSSICQEMENNPHNAAIQIKGLNSLIPFLKTETEVNNFQRAFKCVENAQKANPKNNEISFSILDLFDSLLACTSTYPLLEVTSIFNQIIFLLSQIKSNSRLSLAALETTLNTIKIPRIGPHFSTPQFLENLVYIARANSKSVQHAELLAQISQYIDNHMSSGINDFLSALVVISRNFYKREQLQAEIIQGFAHVCNSKVMNEFAPYSIPHFLDVLHSYPNNYQIFKGFAIIISKSPSSYYQKDLPDIVVCFIETLLEDYDTLTILIQVFSEKAKKLPYSLLPLMIPTIGFFLSDENLTKETLTITFRILASPNEIVPKSPSLINLLTSVLLLYQNNADIVKRAAACIQALSTNSENDSSLLQAGAPAVLMRVAGLHRDKEKTIGFITSALSNFIDHAARQLNTPDYIKLIQSLIKENKKKTNILRSLILILRAIILSSYSFDEFLDFENNSEKEKLLISSSIGAYLLQSQLGDLDLIKAVLLLKSPKSEHSKYVAAAMNKYSSDYDVLMAGLIQGTYDITALTKALTFCGEKAFKYALPCLMNSITNHQVLLPSLVDFILLLDRSDAVSLLMQFFDSDKDSNDKPNQNIIASQFNLNFISQLPLAQKLSENNLWNIDLSSSPDVNLNSDSLSFSSSFIRGNNTAPISNQDQIIVLSALFHSHYDENVLKSALYFAKQVGLMKETTLFLFDVLENHYNNQEIAKNCLMFLAELGHCGAFKPELFMECNPIQILAHTFKSYKKDQEMVYLLLKIFSNLTNILNKYNNNMNININSDNTNNINNDLRNDSLNNTDSVNNTNGNSSNNTFNNSKSIAVNSNISKNIISSFSDSLILPMLLPSYKINEECQKLVINIMGNLASDPKIAKTLYENDGINIIFHDFSIPSSYKVLFYFVNYLKYHLDTKHVKQVCQILGDNNQNLDTLSYYHLCVILLDFCQFSLFADQKKTSDLLPTNAISSLLTLHSSEPLFVKTLSELILYDDNCIDDSEIYVALLDALKNNSDNQETCEVIISALFHINNNKFDSNISSNSKSSIHNNNSTDIYLDVLKNNPSSSIIVSSLLKKMDGNPAALPMISIALETINDEPTLIVISKYMLSVAQTDECYNDDFLSNTCPCLFSLLHNHSHSNELCAQILPLLYYISLNERCQIYVIDHIDLILSLIKMHISNARTTSAGLGILSNISTGRYISNLKNVAPVVMSSLRVWINEPQVLEAGTAIISNFLIKQHEQEFQPILPFLAISFIFDFLNGIMNDNNVDFLLLILHYPGVEESISENFEMIFEILKKCVNNETGSSIASKVFDILGKFQNEDVLYSFSPYISDILDFADSHKVDLATSSIKCIYNIAQINPMIIFPHVSSVSHLGRTKNGEVLRIALKIQAIFIHPKQTG